MLYRLILIFFAVIIAACSNPQEGNTLSGKKTGTFISEKINGKYTVDPATAEELKIMENTVLNFMQMIKRQPANTAAYNEYGNLIEMHINRINEHCRLDENSKSVLCNNLESIRKKIPLLQNNNVDDAEIACKEIAILFSQIDSAFAYRN